jgi:hypothetical protein
VRERERERAYSDYMLILNWTYFFLETGEYRFSYRVVALFDLMAGSLFFLDRYIRWRGKAFSVYREGKNGKIILTQRFLTNGLFLGTILLDSCNILFFLIEVLNLPNGRGYYYYFFFSFFEEKLNFKFTSQWQVFVGNAKVVFEWQHFPHKKRKKIVSVAVVLVFSTKKQHISVLNRFSQ